MGRTLLTQDIISRPSLRQYQQAQYYDVNPCALEHDY